MKKRGLQNRRKGHDAERHYRNVFKDLGYEFCETSRYGSRLHDNAKIDLIGIPFNIQIKAGRQKNMNPGKELFNMAMLIKNMFQEGDLVHSNPNLLIHRKDGTRGKKRSPSDDLVYMSKEQFDEFKKDYSNLKIIHSRKARFAISPPYNEVIAVTFENFKNELLIIKQ